MTPSFMWDLAKSGGAGYVRLQRNSPPSSFSFTWNAFALGDPSASNNNRPYGAVDAGQTRNVGPRFNEYRVSVSGTTVNQPTEPITFANNERVRFTFQGTSQFDPSVSYWVVNANATTFQVSTSQGGTAVDGGTPIAPVNFAGVAYTSEAPTVYIGNYDLTGNSPSISNLDIFGRVTVKSSVTGTPTMTDCIIRGSWSQSIASSSGIDACVWGDNAQMRGLVASWCRIDGTGRETPFTDGFRGGNGTWDYGEIYRVIDGLSFNYPTGTGGTTVRRSRIAWGAFFAWHNDSNPGTDCPVLPNLIARGVTVWPNQSDKRTHSDACQVFQGGPWIAEGNNIGGARAASAPATADLDPYVPADAAIINDTSNALDFPNAGGFMVNTADPAANPVIATISKNWIEGGPSNVNSSPNAAAGDDHSGVTVSYNQCKATTPANWRLIRNTASGGLATFTGNVDENFNPLSPVF